MTRSFFVVAMLGAFALSGLSLAGQTPGPGELPYRNASSSSSAFRTCSAE